MLPPVYHHCPVNANADIWTLMYIHIDIYTEGVPKAPGSSMVYTAARQLVTVLNISCQQNQTSLQLLVIGCRGVLLGYKQHQGKAGASLSGPSQLDDVNVTAGTV